MRLKPLEAVAARFVLASITRPEQVTTGEELARLHRSQGYSKIAVHFVIERDGSIYDGRPLNQPGALAGKHNQSAYQVCLLGGVNDAMQPEDNFTEAQHAALRRLLAAYGKPVVWAPDFPR